MSQLISELVERRLYPRKLRFDKGEVLLELSTLSTEQLDAGFYLPGLSTVKEGDLVLVNLDELEFDMMPVHQPAGFIFHLGRCGSTATVKMLNSLAHYQVISEAAVLHTLVKAQMYKPDGNSLERRRKLVDLFCLLGEAKDSRTIFKFASWEVRLKNVYSKLYPDVKCCLIVRNMLEIMVTVLNDPPKRFKRRSIRAMLDRERSIGNDGLFQYLINTFGPGVDYLADQDFVDFIGGALQDMLNDVQSAAKPYLVINHRDIARQVPTKLCAYFSIKPDEHQIQVMQQLAGYNAKSNSPGHQYVDDSERKSAEATPETRRWCENKLQPLLDNIIACNASLD